MADDQVSDDQVSDEEYEPSAVTLITSYEPGDLLQIQGQLVEIFTIEETGAGLIFKMENDRTYICNDTRHARRGRRLRSKKKLKSSLAPGQVDAMLDKHKKSKKRG